MKRVFVTSDLHLGHKKCSVLRGFDDLDEHDEDLTARWNAKVHPTDSVWVLGDVVFQAASRIHWIGRLNGIKHLVVGNHEHHDISRYAPYFNKIVSSIVYREKYLFTHMPVHPMQLDRRFKVVNVHGHIHKGQDHVYLNDPRYFNVNCEFHNLAPLAIEELDQLIETRNAMEEGK